MLRGWYGSRSLSSFRNGVARWKHEPNYAYRRQQFCTSVIHYQAVIPLRKELKDARKGTRAAQIAGDRALPSVDAAKLAEWELTVGIEIHAQLNTASKLFSRASAEFTDIPNAAIWPFDLSVPGSQPLFQAPVLIPALRAAIALNCKIQSRSTFDRKHYFYHDQPAGYQITQYYEPFAKDGLVKLTAQDGLPLEEGEVLLVGIKQIQLEQDTAKTQEQDDGTTLIDFNRSGHALIEIISLPHIHSPEAAAAYFRKVQAILYSVDAATTGMELGGMRADVNVSIRRLGDKQGTQEYSGVTSLGQRTEIKNLSSFKSVEDAVKAERDRQIRLLESGEQVKGETRGWSLSNPHTTRRLRGKEGSVDYRYMPDPDIPPIYLASDLVRHLRANIPPVPDQLLHMLTTRYSLSLDDAKALLSLDDGTRMLWFQEVVAQIPDSDQADWFKRSITAANWILHELGALLTMNEVQWSQDLISSRSMADLINLSITGKLTGPSAKRLLQILFAGDRRPVDSIVDAEGLRFSSMSDEEYSNLIETVISSHPNEVAIAQSGGRQATGKAKFLLGQLMRHADRSRVEVQKAEALLQQRLKIRSS